MSSEVPQEMRDLLIRLDQQVKDGFHNIMVRFDKMEQRADGHEERLRALEAWRSELNGGARGAGFAANALKWLAPILLGAAGYLGVKVVTDKPQPMVHSQMTVERTVKVPHP